jgi:hypothetical protein
MSLGLLGKAYASWLHLRADDLLRADVRAVQWIMRQSATVPEVRSCGFDTALLPILADDQAISGA